jgi:hypothetical protein
LSYLLLLDACTDHFWSAEETHHARRWGNVGEEVFSSLYLALRHLMKRLLEKQSERSLQSY